MGCSSREEIVEVLDALDGALDRLCELSFDALTTPELLRTLQRLERAARRHCTPRHALINHLDAQAGQEELAGTLRSALADRLRITKAEASRRIADADDLGPRRALSGEPLTPRLAHTASQMRSITSIFFHPIPARTDQLRRRGDHTVDVGSGQRPREPEPGRSGL